MFDRNVLDRSHPIFSKKNARLLLLLTALLPLPSYADLIVGNTSAEVITDIVLAPWGTESFAISTTLSQTNCAATGGWVIFTLSNQSSSQAYDRAFALALSAMSSNQQVLVDASSGTDCTTAYMLAVGAPTQ